MQYLKTADSEWFKQRLTGLMFVAVAVFVILVVRLFYLQILQGRELRRLSERNSIRIQSIDPPRGLVFDRNGHLIVDNRPAFDVGIILKDAKPLGETLEKLAGYLNVPREDLEARIKEQKGVAAFKPIILLQDIGRDALAAVEVHRYDLSGIVIMIKPRRDYLYSHSASHLLGYLGEINADELNCGKYPGCRPGDQIGKFGVEKAYESVLRGRRGGRQVEVNAKGQVVRVLRTVEAKPGHNVFLTLDQRLQSKAEEMLTGRAGAVVAIDPSSGGILAMASSPSFDQNAFIRGLTHAEWDALVKNPEHPMENKAVQGEYPPASTYKIITAIAALEEGVVDETTTFTCPGQYRFGNRVYRCWKKGGHGSVNIIRALAESCDVFFYQVGQKLGVDRLAFYARGSGLGEPTRVNLDHEAHGLIPTAEWKRKRTGIPWQAGETLSVAIGQGFNLVTPIQMASLASAVANRGKRYRPEILKSIRTAGGDLIEEGKLEAPAQLPVEGHTLELVRRGLWEAVNTPGGTAYGSRLNRISISGKTGTAQIVAMAKEGEEKEEEIEEHFKDHAWFVAFAPSEAPEIAVAVIVEHGEHGSSTAAPIAREMIRTYLTPDKSGGKQAVNMSVGAKTEG